MSRLISQELGCGVWSDAERRRPSVQQRTYIEFISCMCVWPYSKSNFRVVAAFYASLKHAKSAPVSQFQWSLRSRFPPHPLRDPLCDLLGRLWRMHCTGSVGYWWTCRPWMLQMLREMRWRCCRAYTQRHLARSRSLRVTLPSSCKSTTSARAARPSRTFHLGASHSTQRARRSRYALCVRRLRSSCVFPSL